MNKMGSRIYEIPFLEIYHKVMEEVTFCIFTANIAGVVKFFTQR